MKFARFRVDGYDYYGQVEADRLRAIQGDLFSGDYRLTGAVYPLDRVKLLPPSRPVNFWGVGENYPAHVQFRIEQMGREIEERARRFTPWHKGVGSLIASGDTVVMPPDLKVLEYEGELCVVIGRPAYRVSKAGDSWLTRIRAPRWMPGIRPLDHRRPTCHLLTGYPAFSQPATYPADRCFTFA